MPATASTTPARAPDPYFGAWNGRGETALDSLPADSFTWTDPMLPAPLDSVAGARAFLTGSWAGMSDLRFELVGGPCVDEANSRVAQEWRMLCTHDGEFNGIPATGKQVDILGTDVFTVDGDGRVTDVRAYYDSATVLRQLGLA